MWRSTRSLLLALVLAFACSPAAIGLTVDVRTDYHPGLDFTQVVTSLTRAEEGFGGEVREETFVVDFEPFKESKKR